MPALPEVLTNVSGLANWWGTVAHPTYSHVEYNHWLGSEQRMVSSWRKDWLRAFSQRHTLSGKRLLDYGIGGGLLGKVLLDSPHQIAHYVGVDISERSLGAARKRLTHAGVLPSQFTLLQAPQAFSELWPVPDALISLAVIQHFPSRAYADAFFGSVEASTIPLLLLQIKLASPPVCDLQVATDAASFVSGAESRRIYALNATTACQLDVAYLVAAMPSFTVTWQGQRRVRGWIEEGQMAWIELSRNSQRQKREKAARDAAQRSWHNSIGARNDSSRHRGTVPLPASRQQSPMVVVSAAATMRDRHALAARDILTRVERLANDSGIDWLNGADAVQKAASAVVRGRPRGYTVLRQIQSELAQLAPSAMDANFRWLAMTMVSNRHVVSLNLRHMLELLPCDFSMYHFDARSERDRSYRAYAARDWYISSKQIVHRGFVTKSGCHVEAITGVLRWLLQDSQRLPYSHLWILDNDLDFGLFSYPAFRALVAFRRPFLSQAALLPTRVGRRSSDRFSLVASFPAAQPAGRERLQDRRGRRGAHGPRDDIDNQPLIDRLLFAPLYAGIKTLDTRDQVRQAGVLNTIAQEFGRAASVWPHPDPFAPHSVVLPSRRSPGLVFDWTPIIHTDSRLLGWGANAFKLTNGTKCPRRDSPRSATNFEGPWQEVASPTLAALSQCLAGRNVGSLTHAPRTKRMSRVHVSECIQHFLENVPCFSNMAFLIL